MDQEKFKKINYELIETFLSAGKLCLDLRKEGLTEELKKDSTPVTNGDLEVNKILVEKISKLTPDIPIVSEESSHNKKNLNYSYRIIFMPETIGSLSDMKYNLKKMKYN